jgi:elongation factor Ts
MGYKAGVLDLTGRCQMEGCRKGCGHAGGAMKPVALNKDGVDSAIIEKEIEIGKELARQEGKPEDMLEKIAMGKLNKFFKENTLLAQAFVKDNSLSVEGYLKSMDKDLTVTGFKHVKLG